MCVGGIPWKIGVLEPEKGKIESGKTGTWMLGIGGPGEEGGGAHGLGFPTASWADILQA